MGASFLFSLFSADVFCHPVLHPAKKMKHFEEYWDLEEQEAVLDLVKKVVWYFLLKFHSTQVWLKVTFEMTVLECYEKLYSSTIIPKKKSWAPAGKKRNHYLSDSDSEPEPQAPVMMSNWESEFNWYISTEEVVPEGMGVVEWWGVCIYSFLSSLSWHLHNLS